MTNEVSAVVISVLKKAEKMLLSIGVKYQIRYPDGTFHGNMPLPPEKPESKPNKKLNHPRGEMTKHILEHINFDAPIGTVISIPISVYGFDSIQSCASSLAGIKWGRGTYTSFRNKKSQCVEMLRHG